MAKKNSTPIIERILLAACSTFWFGCNGHEEAVALYGCPPEECHDDSSSSSAETSSSSVSLSSSSSMDVSPAPLYGVFYSSSHAPSSSSEDLGQIMPEYGVPLPDLSISSSSDSWAESSSSQDLEEAMPVYGIPYPIRRD